jgi:hypothetical protein
MLTEGYMRANKVTLDNGVLLAIVNRTAEGKPRGTIVRAHRRLLVLKCIIPKPR